MSKDVILWSSDDLDGMEDAIFIDYMCGELVKTIKNKVGPSIKIETQTDNWKGSDRYSYIEFSNNYHVAFNQIYPSYDCTFMLHEDEDGLYAVVSSHDAPTGNTWLFSKNEGEE